MLCPRSFTRPRAQADKCAYVREQCSVGTLAFAVASAAFSERATQGVYQLADYLGFYYCTLPDAPAVVFLLLFGWLLVLVRCAPCPSAAVHPLWAARRVLRWRDRRAAQAN